MADFKLTCNLDSVGMLDSCINKSTRVNIIIGVGKFCRVLFKR